MEIALVDMAQRTLPGLPTYPRRDEIPFDADRMRLSTVHAIPEGPTLYCKGALESVLPLCSKMLADGDTRPLDPELREKILAAQETMAEQGLRVLGMITTRVCTAVSPISVVPPSSAVLPRPGMIRRQRPNRPAPQYYVKLRDAGRRGTPRATTSR